jgi:hypothetical protein
LAFLFGSKHETVGFLDFPSVTIVVPCFNEEVNVSNKVEDIFKTLLSFAMVWYGIRGIKENQATFYDRSS